MLSKLFAVLLTVGLAAARVQTFTEQQPWTHLPMVGDLSLSNRGRVLDATPGPPATQTSSSGLGAVGEKQYCNVYSSSGSSPSCTGNYPFPACCDGELCSTNADGTGGKCSSDGPYPACCPAFSRAVDRCDLPDGAQKCSSKTYPVPACCDTDYCYVFSDASSTQCTGSRVAGCCPA